MDRHTRAHLVAGVVGRVPERNKAPLTPSPVAGVAVPVLAMPAKGGVQAVPEGRPDTRAKRKARQEARREPGT